VLEYLLMLKERADAIYDLWKTIASLIHRFHSLDPAVQAMVLGLFFSPFRRVYAKIDSCVSSAPDCLCPFLGIRGLLFEEYPSQQGLLDVLILSSYCAGVTLMFLGGLLICASNDILSICPKIIELYRKHHGTTTGDADKVTEAAEADADFLKVDQATLFHLIMPANYLETKELLNLTCLMAMETVKGKTSDEIYKLFNIKSDFTQEGEAAVYLDMTCQTVVQMFKGKTPEEIRKTFNITSHFTLVEEEVQRENQWAFE